MYTAHIKKINDLEKVLFEDSPKDFEAFDHSPAFGMPRSTSFTQFARSNLTNAFTQYIFYDTAI